MSLILWLEKFFKYLSTFFKNIFFINIVSLKFTKMATEVGYVKLEGKYTYVGFDVDTTGRRLIDEVSFLKPKIFAREKYSCLKSPFCFIRFCKLPLTHRIRNFLNTSCH